MADRFLRGFVAATACAGLGWVIAMLTTTEAERSVLLVFADGGTVPFVWRSSAPAQRFVFVPLVGSGQELVFRRCGGEHDTCLVYEEVPHA